MKMFCIQMPAPSLSQLATPLGDFGSMRLCWMYMGYSGPYQMFAGMVEVVAGLLLLYRRTVTLGLLIGLGVFSNVMTMNLSYDIPVKGYSMERRKLILFPDAAAGDKKYKFYTGWQHRNHSAKIFGFPTEVVFS